MVQGLAVAVFNPLLNIFYPMKYNRYKRHENSSWAYWQFNEYETQINSIYWTGVASVSRASYEVRNATPPVDARIVMCASGPDAKRFPSDQGAFVSNAVDFLKWNRSSFIMAATGAFETYSWRVVLTALMSDPAVVYGKTRAIDGASWLKGGIRPDYTDLKKRVTKDTWNQRYAALRDLFGPIPKIQAHLVELDKIRLFRNNVGHAFGRDIAAAPNLVTRDMERMRSIDDKKFKEWLSVISQAAKALDEVLVTKHIGDFEPMLHFHQYYESFGAHKPTIDKSFMTKYKLLLAATEKHSKGLEYCRGLIRAYMAA